MFHMKLVQASLGIATLFVLVLAGCQFPVGRQHLCRKQSTAPVPPPLPTVDVGGLVTQPGRIEIPTEGLNLRRALTLAGQAVQASATPAVTAVTPSIDPTTFNNWLAANATLGELQQQDELIRKLQGNAALLDVNDLAGLRNQIEDAQSKLDTIQKNVNPAQLHLLQVVGEIQSNVARSDELSALSKNAKVAPEALALVDKILKQDGTKQADRKAKLETLKQQFQSPTTGSAISYQSAPAARLVAIQRQAGSVSGTFYFPYSAASSGSAGEIVLMPGDLIQVLDYQDSALGASSGLGGSVGPFTIQGLVKAPGIRIPTGSTSIQSVLTKDIPTTNDDSAVVTVERTAATGFGREVYIIPRNLATNGTLANFNIRAGDVCIVTTMNLVPIVTHGILSGALQPNGRTIVNNQLLNPNSSCVSKLHSNCQQQLQQQVGQSNDVTAQALQNLQGACKTVTTRLGGNPPAP
jgi:hypothetical protein